MAKARGRPVLTPAQVRSFLRSTGSPQQDAPGRPATQRIGNRPDLRALSTAAFGKGKELSKELIKETKETFKDTKDSKDSKERKEVAKEQVKEQLKEQIKEQLKDIKEKELKEGKELKEKELKEVKEFKEGKEIKEKDKDFEGKPTDKLGEVGGQFGVQPAAVPIEQRLGALEQAVQQLVHFIGQELRPDLSRSALQTSGQAAKDEKDLKDAEKTSDA